MDPHTRTAYEAALLAQFLHHGQTDKAGKDYFEGHLCTVGGLGADWKEQTVGYLHDAAEDTPHTVTDIIGMLKARCPGLSPKEWDELTEALCLLNSHTASSRTEYIERFGGHRLAIRVKLNDLCHNMNLDRIARPTEKDRARAERYRKEYDRLTEMLDALKRGEEN